MATFAAPNQEVLLCCVEVVGAQQAAGEASRGAGDEFAVLTPQRISQLHVPAGSAIAASAAVLVWAIQLQDILLVSKQVRRRLGYLSTAM